MCINMANEQLQHFFNEDIFLTEQDECEREGIVLDRVSFTNNKPVLDVFLEVYWRGKRPIKVLSDKVCKLFILEIEVPAKDKTFLLS